MMETHPCLLNTELCISFFLNTVEPFFNSDTEGTDLSVLLTELAIKGII